MEALEMMDELEMMDASVMLEIGKAEDVFKRFRDMNEPTMLSTLCMLVDIAAARTGKTSAEVVELVGVLTTEIGERLGPWEEVQE